MWTSWRMQSYGRFHARFYSVHMGMKPFEPLKPPKAVAPPPGCWYRQLSKTGLLHGPCWPESLALAGLRRFDFPTQRCAVRIQDSHCARSFSKSFLVCCSWVSTCCGFNRVLYPNPTRERERISTDGKAPSWSVLSLAWAWDSSLREQKHC